MKQLFTKTTTAIFYNLHPQPIQRMLDYDWMCKREPSIVAIVNPTSAGSHKAFFGSKEINIPVYKTVHEAALNHPHADVFVSFASMRSAYQSSLEAILEPTLHTIAITAEGVPENLTRELIRQAEVNKKWIIGPATVGGIRPGAFRIGNTAGSVESIISAKLYRPGSVGVVTISGGMSLEIYHIVSHYTDGVREGVAVGGDAYPGSTLLANLLRLESDPGVKMHVMLGELGGSAEYEIAEAIRTGKIKKPVVAWVTGTVASQFATEVQFGHANAKSGKDTESAQAKNTALREAGAHVPDSFNGFGELIGKVFKKHVADKQGYTAPEETGYQLPPLDYDEAVKQNKVRRPTTIVSSISDDRGEEPEYNKKQISAYVNKPVGYLLNSLWFKGRLHPAGEDFLELCLVLMADHGPAVATAHNAIVTARAGKDVVDSLVAGLLTIGPRHGGALDGAARWAFSAVERKISARSFVEEMKLKGELIMGIGHRIKTAQNPDKRVSLLLQFARKNLKKHVYLDYALEVEQETLKKKNNLILNVDGAAAAIFLDVLKQSRFSNEEITRLIDAGAFNAIFALARSIGIIGHTLDQKLMQEGLYRHPWDDILYL